MSSSQQNGDSNIENQEADLAKAFQELSRGEQTATALENHLAALEAKIEELLAAADSQQSGSSSNDNTTAQNTSDQSSQ